MNPAFLLVMLLGLMALSYAFGTRRSLSLAAQGNGAIRFHSAPEYHGTFTAIWAGLPALLVFALWLLLEGSLIGELVKAGLPDELRRLPADQLGLTLNEIQNVAAGNARSDLPSAILTAAEHLKELQHKSSVLLTASVLLVGFAGARRAYGRIRPELRARRQVERMFVILLALSSSVAIFTTVGIVLSILFEALRFFQAVPFFDFLFGLEWSPQTAIRSDQVGSSGAFGAVPVLAGTLLISGIAMTVGAPIGLLSAIFLSEYATPRQRSVVKPILEVLAGIPTVVYGFFAALTVAPFLRDTGTRFGVAISSESALAAGAVMGIMLIPFVSSLSDDVMNAVPQAMRDGSYGLGATKSETIRKVLLPAALPGIVGAVLLAMSRAIGETMIVVMAAGLSAKLTANPFEAVTTVTVQIVTLLVGDQEFDSPKTLAAFALGLVLFVITLILNVFALHVVRKYREQYE